MRRVLVVGLAVAFLAAPAPALAQPLATLDGGVNGAINIWLTTGGGQTGTPLVHLDEPGLYRFNLTDNIGQHNFWLSGPAGFAEQRTALFEVPIPGNPPPPHYVWDLELPAGVYRYQCEHHAFMNGSFTVGDTLVVGVDSGYGLITSDPAGVSWPTNRGAAFPEGTQVTLTAAPQNASFTFNGWLSGCSGVGTCTVTVTGRTEVRAVFGSAIGTGGGGTVTAPATLVRVAVVKTTTRRVVRATLDVKRETAVTAQLRRNGRVLASARAQVLPGTRLVRVPVPRGVKAGAATLRLVLRDIASDQRFTLSRAIRIPR
jgi:Divergent InlB B-repeat domain